MASLSTQPKSILKKTTYPATSIPTTTKSTTSSQPREDRNRDVALYHANIIQLRKDIELEILFSMDALIDLPLSRPPAYSSSNPSASDATTFKTLLRPFRPSDYDELIVERNINEHCGYVLCPKPRVKEDGGRWKLLGKTGRAKDFRIVERSETEKWCGDECARRAMYVRVQLGERPAWERETSDDVRIDLLDEPKEDQEMEGVVEGMDRMELDLDSDLKRREREAEGQLALERGDTSSRTRDRMVNVRILEKDVVGEAQPPTLSETELSGKLGTLHLSLEGHTSTFGTRGEWRHDEQEDLDTDWTM